MKDPELWYNERGHLVMAGETPPEAICPSCGQRIRWVLDMFSFISAAPGSPHSALAHARCAWRPEAFTREKRDARAIQKGK